jgi:predicted site-specific integrase-resolvase
MSEELKNTTPEKWVNLEDIAVHLSVSEDTVRTWVKEGKLRFIARVSVINSKFPRSTNGCVRGKSKDNES